jgi:hypothetical protein
MLGLRPAYSAGGHARRVTPQGVFALFPLVRHKVASRHSDQRHTVVGSPSSRARTTPVPATPTDEPTSQPGTDEERHHVTIVT